MSEIVSEFLGQDVHEDGLQPRVAVVTPSLPSRVDMLAEAKACVLNQTEPCTHLIAIDEDNLGPAAVRNFLCSQAAGAGFEYVAFLDDDDLIDDDHVETLLHAVEEDSSTLAFSWYRRTGSAPETPRVEVWDDWCWGTMLGGRNLIPVTVVARLQPLLDEGLFGGGRYEDYDLWMRLLNHGATISVIPRETWTYRGLDDTRTWL